MSQLLAENRLSPWWAGWTGRLLAVWCVGWLVAYRWTGGLSWHFFVQGERALTDVGNSTSGGLHLYAALPQLQIGPITLVAAWLISPFGTHVSLFLAQLLGVAAGVGLVLAARDLAGHVRPDLAPQTIDRRTYWAAVFFTPAWLYLAVASVHLDDVLAMSFGVLALLAARRQHALPAGLAAALAVDAKPWAVPFVVVLLIIEVPHRRAQGAFAFALGVLACWLPFFVADAHTLNAVRFTIVNTPRSALRLLGVHSPRTPHWDRPAQSLLGLALATVAIRHGRWAAVPLLVVAARIVLDPGTNRYYIGGLVVGTLLWDLVGARADLPWWTITATVTLFLARYAHLPPSANGWLTLGFFVAAVGLAGAPRPTFSDPNAFDPTSSELTERIAE